MAAKWRQGKHARAGSGARRDGAAGAASSARRRTGPADAAEGAALAGGANLFVLSTDAELIDTVRAPAAALPVSAVSDWMELELAIDTQRCGIALLARADLLGDTLPSASRRSSAARIGSSCSSRPIARRGGR
jgi:hypothetical protein